ncbi:MAG: QueT transporter family protein, partial [Bacilli bacterium]|nr:QueT transporter family protein [Bacilli bacterium]
MERVVSPSQKIIRFITRNAIVVAMYYAFTMLMVFFPVISQFGPMQCRFSEILVLLAFFDPSLTFGLTLGCFFANL